MATNLALNDALRVRFYCYEAGATQVGINTSYWLVTSLTGTVTDGFLANGIGTRIGQFYKNYLGANSQYSGCGVSIMQGVTTHQRTAQVFDNGGAGAGVNDSPNLANQTSYVISLRTGLASRHARGRVYPPFPTADQADQNGLMTIPAQVLIQQLAEQYQTAQVFAAGGNSVTVQCSVRGVVAGVAAYPLISSAFAQIRFGTQRRRGQYGRLNQVPS